MKNFQIIITDVQNSEINTIEARKANFKVYVSHIELLKTATKIELTAIAEAICKKTPIALQTVKDNFTFILKGAKLGLDLNKYNSFNAVKKANSEISSKLAVVVKSGVNKGTAKVSPSKVAEKTQSQAVIIAAKNEAIELIKKDDKFAAFLKYAKEQNFDLNLVRLAIK